MLQGLRWIGGGDGGIEMDTRWEEGMGRNAHALELQELGELLRQTLLGTYTEIIYRIFMDYTYSSAC
jgi:hypothetical protein